MNPNEQPNQPPTPQPVAPPPQPQAPIQPQAAPQTPAPQPTEAMYIPPQTSLPQVGPDGLPLPQYPISASQLGLTQPPDDKFSLSFNKKNAITWGVIVGGILIMLLIALFATNTVSVTRLSKTSYENKAGDQFKLKFYSKHRNGEYEGIKQLVSKVSIDDKYPVTLSIDSNDSVSAYSTLKDCTNMKKLFKTHNDAINADIQVCELEIAAEYNASIYLAGFMKDNRVYIVTFSQDLEGVDISNRAAAKKALEKAGLNPYQEDIKKIVSSIEVKD